MNEFTDKKLQLYVLQMIKYNIDASTVVGDSFSYQDIASSINILKAHGKVSSLEGNIKLTFSGEEYYNYLLNELGFSGKGPVILPQYKYFDRKIDKFDIYLKNKSSR